MKKNTSLVLSLVVSFTLLISSFAPLARAQQAPPQQRPPIVVPQTQPPPQQQPVQSAPPAADAQDDDEDDVVRITTNLVQMDVVVVDKKGNQVTDLTAEDFEVYEDKRQQKITNFSYVLNESAPRPAAPNAVLASSTRPTPVDKNAPPAPPRHLRPEQVRRTMALVVDDLGLSFASTAYVRDALRKFVNEQMQPYDLVAIIRTSAGMGALQQFTSDKRQLHAAIDRVKWNLAGRVSAFAPVRQSGMPQNRISMGGEDSIGEGDTAAEIEQFREDLYAVGTLGAVNFVVRGMRELPGRKSVTLFTDGFSLRTSDRGPSSERVFQALRGLTELANRASVVIYTIDARGLVAPGFTAEDDTADMNLEDLDRVQRSRAFEIFDTQGGMDYLSRQTGGFLIKNSNDLSRGVRRIIEDQKGYYLIGYRPEGATFNRRYHTFSVKVKRPGLRVRTRTGFYGIRDEDTRPVRRTREQQLLGALISPFSSPDVRLRLTAIFGNDVRSGSFVTALMHINASDLKFNKQADGTYKAALDVAGVTYTDNGRVVDSRDQTGTLIMREEIYQKALRDGLVYSFAVPIKKAGAYQLRMAVRDTTTEHTGSASQFIEVPDLKKNRLALSGLVVSGLRASDNATTKGTREQQAAGDGNAASLASPAVRRFGLNSTLDFAYAIYNARLDKASGRPQLTAQTRLFRDGEPVYNGEARPLNLTSPLPDPERIQLGGSIKLGSNLPPGEYVLQIVVTDLLATGKHRTATQWIDFEIVK
ncbi:MAG TPA: VWA domain-containing protein [Pyrinomonadaceae bacterium]|nr:VWA domain-containing protein [Pyrinomonadaceae bacterium]